MMSTQIRRIGLVGAGFMGSGIAETCAVSGIDVTAFEPEQAPLDRSRGRLEESIARAVTRGKLSRDDADAVVGRIAYTTDMADLDGVDAHERSVGVTTERGRVLTFVLNRATATFTSDGGQTGSRLRFEQALD